MCECGKVPRDRYFSEGPGGPTLAKSERPRKDTANTRCVGNIVCNQSATKCEKFGIDDLPFPFISSGNRE
jgi:hypothetical protein